MREKNGILKIHNFVQRPLRNVEKYKIDFSKSGAQISTNTLKLPTFYVNLKQLWYVAFGRHALLLKYYP